MTLVPVYRPQVGGLLGVRWWAAVACLCVSGDVYELAKGTAHHIRNLMRVCGPRAVRPAKPHHGFGCCAADASPAAPNDDAQALQQLARLTREPARGTGMLWDCWATATADSPDPPVTGEPYQPMSGAERHLLPDHLRETEHLLHRLQPAVAYRAARHAGPSTESSSQQGSRTEAGRHMACATYEDLLWQHRGEPHRHALLRFFTTAAGQATTRPGGSHSGHVACPGACTAATRADAACCAERLLEARLRRRRDLVDDTAFPREWEEGQWRLINGILPRPTRMHGTPTPPATSGNADVQIRRRVFQTPDAQHAMRPMPAARAAMHAKRLCTRKTPRQTAAAQQLLAVAVLVTRQLFQYGGRTPRARRRSARRIANN
ncbi:UNVERIFIED_CONTAM: hypothetical protein K2H54_002092 [Gekko kuhli]